MPNCGVGNVPLADEMSAPEETTNHQSHFNLDPIVSTWALRLLWSHPMLAREFIQVASRIERSSFHRHCWQMAHVCLPTNGSDGDQHHKYGAATPVVPVECSNDRFIPKMCLISNPTWVKHHLRNSGMCRKLEALTFPLAVSDYSIRCKMSAFSCVLVAKHCTAGMKVWHGNSRMETLFWIWGVVQVIYFEGTASKKYPPNTSFYLEGLPATKILISTSWISMHRLISRNFLKAEEMLAYSSWRSWREIDSIGMQELV